AQAFCTGCELVADRPSMVTMRSVGLMSPTRMEQERCTSSLMCTEQAPHCATPQPYFVPVRPTCSRMTHRSGVAGSTSTSLMLPLMLSFAMSFLLRDALRESRRSGTDAARLDDSWRAHHRGPWKNSPSGKALPTAIPAFVAAVAAGV